MELLDRIKEGRNKLNLSQDALASELHVSRQAISKWETGQSYPDLEKLIALSDIFGVTLDELVRSDKRLEKNLLMMEEVSLEGYGRMKHTDLERLFTGRIEDESILCTDSYKSYIKFAKNLDVELQQIKRGKHKEGIYHIQHINAFHSKLKEWMYGFHSVATKYLANYMYWFKWLQFFNTEKDTVKTKHLLVQSHTYHSDTKLKDFKIREVIYI